MDSKEELQVYLEPRDTVYAMGMDPAAGRGGGDFGSLTVLDAYTGEEVVAFRSSAADYLDVANLARELHDFGYRAAKGNTFLNTPGGLVPEANNEALMPALFDLFPLEYFYIQARPARPGLQEESPQRYGYWTGGPSKKRLLDTFSSWCELGKIKWHNPWLSQEVGRWVAQGGLWTYQVKSEMQAVLGHGDVTMSMAFASMGVITWNESEARKGAPFVQEAPKPYMSISGRSPVRSKWMTPAGGR